MFQALEQKAVYGPMSFIFFYNLLQVREEQELISDSRSLSLPFYAGAQHALLLSLQCPPTLDRPVSW